MAPLTVGILGATGATGGSIVNALIEDGGFHIVALTRPQSMEKPKTRSLKDRGVELRPLDVHGPLDEAAAALKGIESLVSTVGPGGQLEQIPLADAAKAAGVKRFLPCGAQPVIPPGGVQDVRDEKEKVFQHIKVLGLPYTYVDVGWWYQISFPSLPSGKTDYMSRLANNRIVGDGTKKWAITDLRDIGKYFAAVLKDERTINKSVLVYNEVHSQEEIFTLTEKLSGETIERQYVPAEQHLASIADANKKIEELTAKGEAPPPGSMLHLQKMYSQYMISLSIRGDNTPEYAKYLGYVTSKELYPDLKFTSFEDFLKELLAGNAKKVYEGS